MHSSRATPSQERTLVETLRAVRQSLVVPPFLSRRYGSARLAGENLSRQLYHEVSQWRLQKSRLQENILASESWNNVPMR